MSSRRTVVQTDHHTARVLQLDADPAKGAQVHEHSHHTRQHGSRTAQSDFRHDVDEHRPALADRILGWQTFDQPTQGQLLALAKAFVVAHDDMAPT